MIRAFLKILPVALALAGCGMADPGSKAESAPPFKGQGLDKVHYSLLDMALTGPVILCFVPPGCPEFGKRLVFLDLLQTAYKGKAQSLGVFCGNESEFAEWAAKTPSKIPWIPDPGLLITEKYELTEGPLIMVVSQRGRIEGRWTGLSRQNLEDINSVVAKLAEQSVAKIDLASAPVAPVAPCRFNLPRRDFSKP